MATFVRVVDAGSLAAAAGAWRSSLRWVSRHISALEQHFGTPLLLRTTRHLALTDNGRILYERAKSILHELKEVETALARGRHAPSGQIRISAPTLIGRLLIAPLLAEFVRRYPQLTVDLLLVDRAVDMVEEDIHLSLRIGHLPDSSLVARKLADLRMVVCASPAYLERRGIPQEPADLSRHDCLVFSDTPGIAGWRFKNGAKTERRIRISGRLWVNSLDTLVSAAQDGAGLVRVPSWQVDTDIADGALQRVLVVYEPKTATHRLLFQPSRLTSPKSRVFVDYLVERWRAADPFGAHATASSKQ